MAARKNDQRDERVSLAPLSPQEALAALLRAKSETEPRSKDAPKEPR